MFNPQQCKQFIEKMFTESALPSLMKYIQIPNLSRSYDPQWNSNGRLLQAANHIKHWVESVGIEGLSTEVIHDEGYSPIIFTQIKGDLPETVFFYGHFDKQPAFEGWLEGLGATKPVIKEDKLYGRGGADDGYSTYGTMLAIKAVQQQGIKLPRCVMITQGDQQSGSVHMQHYLPLLQQRIGSPKIFFCLDSGAIDYQRLWLSTSLRGNLVGTLKVSTMRDGAHSGDSSGIVPNCYRIAKLVLNRIENGETGQINSDFHVDVPAEFYKQSYQLAEIKGNEAVKAFPFVEGAKAISENIFTSIINRTWKPTLTVTGQTGFPMAEGSGNVNLPQIQLRFSLRLPPTLDAKKAEQNIKQLLQSNPPYSAKVQLTDVRAGYGWTTKKYDEFLQNAIAESSRLFYNEQYLCQGEGGSIPLMNTLSQTWPQGQFVITGVLGPNSNAHGPNQFLHIPYTKKLVCCMAFVLAKCSENYQQK